MTLSKMAYSDNPEVASSYSFQIYAALGRKMPGTNTKCLDTQDSDAECRNQVLQAERRFDECRGAKILMPFYDGK